MCVYIYIYNYVATPLTAVYSPSLSISLLFPRALHLVISLRPPQREKKESACIFFLSAPPPWQCSIYSSTSIRTRFARARDEKVEKKNRCGVSAFPKYNPANPEFVGRKVRDLLCGSDFYLAGSRFYHGHASVGSPYIVFRIVCIVRPFNCTRGFRVYADRVVVKNERANWEAVYSANSGACARDRKNHRERDTMEHRALCMCVCVDRNFRAFERSLKLGYCFSFGLLFIDFTVVLRFLFLASLLWWDLCFRFKCLYSILATRWCSAFYELRYRGIDERWHVVAYNLILAKYNLSAIHELEKSLSDNTRVYQKSPSFRSTSALYTARREKSLYIAIKCQRTEVKLYSLPAQCSFYLKRARKKEIF